MKSIPLAAQTTYADLVERCAAAAFERSFMEPGCFVAKSIKGRQGQRRYWYFQETSENGRKQRYVGPESPELLERIAEHNSVRDDESDRRAIVSALVRSYGFPRPLDEIGRVIAALADAGVFRLRAVLVGTSAYQTYAAMLGVRLPSSALTTEDVDIAQFGNISVAVADEIPPLLDVLKRADATFVSVPHSEDGRRSTSYRTGQGLRVDFLTPNEGGDTDEPQTLQALQTDAQPLRFLDFLIHDSVPAVVLHSAGVYVQVPSPERYAVHKLIVARRRHAGSGKSPKDLLQAQGLISVLVDKRPHDLRAAWAEATGRGPAWEHCLLESLLQISALPRDKLLKTLDWTRDQVPGLALTIDRTAPRYDFDRDVISILANDAGGAIRCEISREALEDYFKADGLSPDGMLRIFLERRSVIEHMMSVKYLKYPIEQPGTVPIKTADLETLRAVQLSQ